jgi:ABC-2 type transport system ATP-binding protein
MTIRSSEVVVDLAQVVKNFGSTRALSGLDLQVRAGEVHAYLGPNGAGKTTTLRLLLGQLRADGGSLRVLGGDPWADAASLHHRIASVPGDVALWPNLSGGEIIDLLGSLRGGLDPARRATMVERFELDPTKKARSYSKGNRQKVALVAALASTADLYLLDEPTSGLDPLMEAEFRDCVRELRDAGATVLLSSHILSEAEALCDRVSIIRSGAVVQTGTLDDLRQLTRTSVTATLAAVPTGLGAIPGVHDLTVDAATVSAQVEPQALGAFVAALSTGGIEALRSQPPTLEELFLRHYGEGSAA